MDNIINLFKDAQHTRKLIQQQPKETRLEFSDRMQRIKDSLDRINDLMVELKSISKHQSNSNNG